MERNPASVTDVSVRTQAELWFLDALVENIPNMIFVKDARDLRFVRFNRAGAELLGYDVRELIGKNDFDVFPREEAEFFTSTDREVLAGGRMIDIPEETIHTRTGTRILHTKKIPIYDVSGRPIYLLGISEDITERKQNEVGRQQIFERLRELDRLKTRLIANVSHEFRTPLALIRSYVDRFLQRTAPGGLDRADLEGIARNVQIVLGLVNDLLDVAKLEAGKLSPDYAEVDLARLVRLTTSSFDVLAAEREISFDVETPASLTAQVDPGRVRRILENLLANAFRHAPAGGRVRCVLESRDERARLLVADSGEGIAPAQREKVFERFYQIDSDERRAGGTGLGLTIVKEFAELHGGSVSVDRAPEGGAMLVVDLPIRAPAGVSLRASAAPAGEVATPTVVAVAPPPPVAGAEGPLVLVVEDSRELSRFLADALGSRFRVAVAFDGEEGLRCALATPPDLILTDIMLPRMRGDQLVHAVRARAELDGVPIVVLTAWAEDDLRIQLLREGAQDYIVKPFSTPELVARVEVLVALKRARDILKSELQSSREDVEALARELATRKRELELLIRASDALAESLDYRTTLASVARLAVPDLADWCVVDVIEGPEKKVDRVASAHVDPSRERLLEELAELYPLDPGSPQMPAVALRTGEPQLLTEVSDESLRELGYDEELVRRIGAVGMATSMSVPLVAHGRGLGVITLVSFAPGRRYDQMDVAFAMELARIAALAIDNARLYAESQNAIRVRDEFLSVASHELRTPLTSMILAIQSLEEARDVRTISKMVSIAARQTGRLTSLVDQLLDTTRIGAGRLLLDVAEVDLRGLVEQVVARFEPDLSRARCTVSIQGAPKVTGRWDRSRLEQVVLNLLSNASKFGAGQPIEISIEQVGGVARLAVKDHGIGIEPAHQRAIFDRFARAVSAREYGGLGLGLYISHRIVEAHGGSIRVESQPGQGATFIVQLPVRHSLDHIAARVNA